MNLSSLIGMVFEDRLTIDTPEGVPLELTLAGVGSRFTSALIDYLFQTIILVALCSCCDSASGSTRARAASPRLLGVCFFVVFWATTSRSRCSTPAVRPARR
jgi:hypothetical protein